MPNVVIGIGSIYRLVAGVGLLIADFVGRGVNGMAPGVVTGELETM